MKRIDYRLLRAALDPHSHYLFVDSPRSERRNEVWNKSSKKKLSKLQRRRIAAKQGRRENVLRRLRLKRKNFKKV